MSHVKKSKRHRRPSELSNFPPEFYDRLSKIWLTTRALRELDRRNRLSRKERPRNYDRSLPSLSRYARHGGPDLTEIRGVSLIAGIRSVTKAHITFVAVAGTKYWAQVGYRDDYFIWQIRSA